MRRPVLVDVALDEETQRGHVPAVRVGELVDGVQVAQVPEDGCELGVELRFAE